MLITMLTRRQFTGVLGASAVAALTSRRTAARQGAGTTLEQTLADVERRLRARLGASILDTGNGRHWGYRASERFPMCSTFKLLAAAAVLSRVDRRLESLDRRIGIDRNALVTYSPVTELRAGGSMTLAELCEAAVTLSDNTAGNLILTSLGGPQGVTDFARALGDRVTRLDRWETALNEATPGDTRDTTSPDAMATTVGALVNGERLSQASTAQLVSWMVSSKTGDAKLRAGLPKDWRTGDKTGAGAHGSVNDVAATWPPNRKPIVIALYITDTTSTTDDANAAMAEIARTVTRRLGY